MTSNAGADGPTPPGASQLMGLFAPPPGSEAEESGNGETQTEDEESASKGEAGSTERLMNLFQPPPSSTSGDGKSSANRNKRMNRNEVAFRDSTDTGFAQNDSLGKPPPDPAGGTQQLSELFHVLPPSKPPRPGRLERDITITRSNQTQQQENSNSNSNSDSDHLVNETYPLLDMSSSSMGSLDSSPRLSSTDATPKMKGLNRKSFPRLEPPMALPVIAETSSAEVTNKEYYLGKLKSIATECAKPTTYIGSFMFLLYHVVFCLAMGSAIIRPNNPTSILGLMTKTAALGIIASASVYWIAISDRVPALYPTTDLFLAPFLANLAVIVDDTLAADESVSTDENDAVFLATFSVLSGIGILSSGILHVLAGVFKLANMGSFLPFPVICGFFSAVGVLTWTLAITVDTSGQTIAHILKSGDVSLYMNTIAHHLPSVAIASVMKYLGPKNPFFVVFIVLGSISLFYIIMFIGGISLEEARDNGWFWSHDDLVYIYESPEIGFDRWAPPAPFGVLNELTNGMVHWGAVYNGLSTALALGFLYLIRCSVHGTALKKNVPNLSRTVVDDGSGDTSPAPPTTHPNRRRLFSESIDIEAVMISPPISSRGTDGKAKTKVIYAESSNITLKEILLQYGLSQFVSALVGGFAVTPSVAASPTMYSLGAEGIAPQIGSVILLLSFYLTDFRVVQYIPKPAFSSMLVLAFIDMIFTWFYKSYFKIRRKSEWLVVPAIVICAFALDLLSSVFVGIALSTFIFVASFNRVGVVKFAASGCLIHSTIERTFKSADWLNENGHLIEVVVLQNFLFFGNAQSVYAYICSMFECDPKDQAEGANSLKPRYIIIDGTLVTGCDASTVDVFNDIKMLCKSNKCKLLMSGLSPSLRATLALGGFKPDSGEKSRRLVRFFQSLDAALGKAEDLLLETMYEHKEPSLVGSRRQLLSNADNGFRMALRHIDEQHGDCYSMELVGLQEYTSLVELEPGDDLYGVVENNGMGRGLFFIEEGVLKVVQNTSATLTRGSNGSMNALATRSLSKLNRDAMLERAKFLGQDNTFRLARIGPGWIAGAHEAVSGERRMGDYIAVTHCRLYHLPYDSVSKLQGENPPLVLNLYKLLSFMMARRQEATIGQLATLHSIMTSPAHHSFLRKKSS